MSNLERLTRHSISGEGWWVRAEEADREIAELRAALRILDRITEGDEQPDGNEPEWVCQIVERFVKLRAENERLREQLNKLESLPESDKKELADFKAYLGLPGDTIEKLVRQRDALQADLDAIRDEVHNEGGIFTPTAKPLDGVRTLVATCQELAVASREIQADLDEALRLGESLAEDVIDDARDRHGDGRGGVHPALRGRFDRDVATAQKFYDLVARHRKEQPGAAGQDGGTTTATQQHQESDD